MEVISTSDKAIVTTSGIGDAVLLDVVDAVHPSVRNERCFTERVRISFWKSKAGGIYSLRAPSARRSHVCLYLTRCNVSDTIEDSDASISSASRDASCDSETSHSTSTQLRERRDDDGGLRERKDGDEDRLL